MKRFLIIGLIVGLVLVIVGGVGVVFAQVQGNAGNNVVTITTSQNGGKSIQQYSGPQSRDGIIVVPGGQGIDKGILIGPGRGGMMGRNEQGYGPGGMMGRNENGYGPGGMMGGRGMGEYRGVMHEYMISAFASAVGLTVDEVNTRLANHETPAQIAIAQGKSEADLPALWQQVRQDAVNKAVAAGVITQAQADVMLQHMNNYAGSGIGPGFGNCPMWDGDEAQP
jgi:hypothetical protein